MRNVVRRALLAGVVSVPALLGTAAQADLPVIDFNALVRWSQQATQMANQLTQMTSMVHSLTNIPQNMMTQVEGLLSLAIRNPLQDITGNLQTLMNGAGTGHCAGATGILTMNQYQPAAGADFTGAWLNGSAARTAGLIACTQQMMQGTQDRLDQMPQLLNELQACTDVSCTTAIQGRIQLETATIAAQQQQAILIGQQAQFQRWTAEDQILQRQRRDAQDIIDATGGGNYGGGAAPLQAAPMFNAANFGG